MEPSPFPAATPERRVFANRTLNLRSLRAIGYDMDYTLVHYDIKEWEKAAFDRTRELLSGRGFPVDGLEFDPANRIQGLVFDMELGNLVKATRFGYIIRAHHGTRTLSYGEVRQAYSGTFINLSEERWRFTNTMFSLSQESLLAQLVDRLDEGSLEVEGRPAIMGYDGLYRLVDEVLGQSHWQGDLKAEIQRDPGRFVQRDPLVAQTLRDQRAAGRKTFLITNSDWVYTSEMMTYALAPDLAEGESWRDLFDLVIVSANKPSFFEDQNPFYRVVDEKAGLLQPHFGALKEGAVYFGGNAAAVEQSFNLSGGDILYVGDHLFGDVHVSKSTLRWRTALIIRELEDEIRESALFAEQEEALSSLMALKGQKEDELSQLRMARQRSGDKSIDKSITEVRRQVVALDDQIGPIAGAAGKLGNTTWGPLMRAGIDKSLFARQVERYADVYTSRVSNFGFVTPYGYLRAGRSNLPHDAAGNPADAPLLDGDPT